MTSVTIASPYGNSSSINPRDHDSFASYLTHVRESFHMETSHTGRTHSSFQINSSRRRSADGEIEIFDAEKYFNGTIFENKADMLPDNELNLPSKKHIKSGVKSWSRRAASTCSVASANSRTGLIRQNSRVAKADGKKLLRVFLCNCSGKTATDTEVEIDSARESLGSSAVRNKRDEIRLASEMRMKRLELGFTEGLFCGIENLKGIEGKEVFRGTSGDGEKKVLNPSEIQPSSVNNNVCHDSSTGSTSNINRNYVGGGDNYVDDDDDNCSESSSDLFEINSISINSSALFDRDTVGSVVYEPSEVSIDWSVVTASAANFSVSSEIDEPKKRSTKGNRKGLLMGCVSHKAVDVTTNSHLHKLSRRADTAEMKDMLAQIGHEALVAPAMRYQVESLTKKGMKTVAPSHVVPPARSISRIQAQRRIYIRS